MLVVGKLNWMHVPATVTLTSIGCNPNLERIAHVRALQDEILSKGEAANPRSPPSGARGRTEPGNKPA
ncbi:MAG: hypothetical protein IPN78_13065 [Candidatus Accumulibacter sp.]|jgi:hypothetical protein|nr:hypothetical protein [Candidatus Accumulibacter propinquus]